MGHVAKDFLITDPETFPGVELTIPPGIAPTDLLPDGYYSEVEVRCSFCLQRQRHKRGYFAVLPSGALALCGNCCARRATSKETVERIDRAMEKRIAAARRKARVEPLIAGLAELVAHLDREILPTERQAFATHAELRRAFPDGIPARPDGPTIGKGRGGLASILKASGMAKVADLPALWEKRRMALDMIARGLDQLPPLTGIVSPRGLKTSLWYFAAHNDYQAVTLDDGWIVAFRGESGDGNALIPVSDLPAPDVAAAKEMVAELRKQDQAPEG